MTPYIQPAPGVTRAAPAASLSTRPAQRSLVHPCLDGPHKEKSPVTPPRCRSPTAPCTSAARHRIANGASREVHAWVVGTSRQWNCAARNALLRAPRARRVLHRRHRCTDLTARAGRSTDAALSKPNHTSRVRHPHHTGLAGALFLPARRAAPQGGLATWRRPNPPLNSCRQQVRRKRAGGPTGQPTPTPDCAGRVTFSALRKSIPKAQAPGIDPGRKPGSSRPGLFGVDRPPSPAHPHPSANRRNQSPNRTEHQHAQHQHHQVPQRRRRPLPRISRRHPDTAQPSLTPNSPPTPAQHLTNSALKSCSNNSTSTPPPQPGRCARLARTRRLPVGDAVVIAETAWACASAARTRVTTDELHAALIAR
jgi:hypothetical protein